MDDDVRIFLDERKLLVAGQQSSYQQFDKAILALSTGGLALSVTFLRDVFQQKPIVDRCILVASWGLFCLAILLTLTSFLTSQYAYGRQIQITEDYYVRKDKEALNAKNKFSRATASLNIASALSFILAVISTVVFVAINFLWG
jgi:hypothetical protein